MYQSYFSLNFLSLLKLQALFQLMQKKSPLCGSLMPKQQLLKASNLHLTYSLVMVALVNVQIHSAACTIKIESVFNVSFVLTLK